MEAKEAMDTNRAIVIQEIFPSTYINPSGDEDKIPS